MLHIYQVKGLFPHNDDHFCESFNIIEEIYWQLAGKLLVIYLKHCKN